ncbi:MAG: MaoC family dehydratase [Chloroflexota bacterium]|nr:MaoC family dehydratase [Chloroflexota bacterium]MDE2884337.1 MaoC family dehydratase [Chloroflexota bacterium]
MSGAPATLAPVERRITQERLVEYADASGDHNPLHLDEEFARGTPYGRTIAHGMLVLALVSELMTGSFREAWLRGGRLKTRFRAPVFPGDTVRATGTLKGSDGATATYDVAVTNEGGENVITGEASVTLDA